jgi:excinuclease ABC subunit A
MSSGDLIIEGARQNNLKNISLRLPHNKFIAVTGVSGSGKSSLAFDTIFAEGQWRFIESLSTYARLFLEKLDRPDVDAIRNVRPAIALEQRNPVKTSRSTVGTVTEIYDYLRLLFAKIAMPHCPDCGEELRSWTPSSAVKDLVEKFSGQKAMIIFTSGDSQEELQKKGFHRVIIDGKVADVSSLVTRCPSMDVVLDRLVIRDDPRLADSIETAWEHGNGAVKIEIVGESSDGNITLLYQSELKCLNCNRVVAKPQPLLFSFNHPIGACPACKGFGNVLEYSEDCIVPDRDLSLAGGAIEPWGKPSHRWWYRQFAKKAASHGINMKIPYKKLSDNAKALVFEGTEDFYGLNDYFEHLENKRYKLHVRVFLSRYRKAITCKTCGGRRLRPEALAFTVGGMNISRMSRMSIGELTDFLSGLHLSEYEREVSSEILRQAGLKLDFLRQVGINYLTLDREAKTLSGGESQRINLANQIASKLTGTLYVLDEPTVGLHPRDVSRIAGILLELASAGNTIVTVEHDRDIINSADWIVELGPGGGDRGGDIVYAGPVSGFPDADTLTCRYLKDSSRIPVPPKRKKGTGKSLILKGARGNNLKNIDVSIPLRTLTCISGVSGSGKSSLVQGTIYNALARHFKVSFEPPLTFRSIKGLEHLKGIKIIDQQPIGKSPRSNPVTYIKAFDSIRKIFADQNESRISGYGAGHFSFNTAGGRCEVCQGAGFQKLEMYFFEDLYMKCEECGGKKFRPEILNISYNGKNIHEVLNLTVDEAAGFFTHLTGLVKKLKLMSSVGLGYLRLGQPATTLSGGEAQRLKICSELGISKRENYLYILDEPTVGLHPDDINRLLKVLNDLVHAGNTVLIVEHNLDVIKSADWLIDLGPEGGEGGGYIVSQGKPEEVAAHSESYTGQYLREYL